ncbi:MAG: endolytic transglycosylase MltG [Desulfobulbaceae bacterium]|nr:endolytic transglycosylase MltG [Desulfobulbaceae bacterium]
MTDPALQTESSTSTLKQLKRIVLWTILLTVFALLACGGWYGYYVISPGPETDSETVTVTIPRGTSVRGIANILAQKNVIHDDFRFLLLASFSGYSSKLQAGEFLLQTGRKPGEVLRKLASARSIEYAITIPEGLRAAEIAEIFGEAGWCDPKKFISLIYEKPFMEKLGFGNLASLEGYLYPDTYLFTKDIQGAEKIIPIMVKQFTEVWQELSASLEEEVDREKTVILASIVEKETGAPEERPLIAGVFSNRLRSGMRLQSDPTVVYGSEKFSMPITRKDLKTPTAYNTYTLPGLPVGPICNPGKEALGAVLRPATTKHIYFVSKNNGTHHFSNTLREHNRAVQKYQRKKKVKKGK